MSKTRLSSITMNRLPTVKEIADNTKYKIVYDGKIVDKDVAYVDALKKLNRAILKHGEGVRLIIQ